MTDNNQEQSVWVLSEERLICRNCGKSYRYNDDGYILFYNYCPFCGKRIASIVNGGIE